MRARSILGALVIVAASACNHDEPPVASNVDLQQFEGKWFEIAHLPRPLQRDCTGTVATYTRQPDGSFSFVHECTLGSGAYFGATAIATVKDARVPAKLAVDFGGFVGDYWILNVASDYRYAVVGHPSRDYLWILSRAPTLSAADHDAVLAHAKDSGFDVGRLEYTPPAPLARGTPAPPVHYGCAASPPELGRSPLTAWLGIGIVAAVAWKRRRGVGDVTAEHRQRGVRAACRRRSADRTPGRSNNPKP